jgi:hypothetical protein
LILSVADRPENFISFCIQRVFDFFCIFQAGQFFLLFFIEKNLLTAQKRKKFAKNKMI